MQAMAHTLATKINDVTVDQDGFDTGLDRAHHFRTKAGRPAVCASGRP